MADTLTDDDIAQYDAQNAAPADTQPVTDADIAKYDAQSTSRPLSDADIAAHDAQEQQTGVLGAVPSGIAAGFKSLAGGSQLLSGQDVAPEAPEQFTGTAAQITHGIFKSIPALIAGLGAGSAGGLVSGPGGLATGALGYGTVAGIQDLYDEYQAGLQKFDGDKAKAFAEAQKTATITAGGSTISWAAFPIKAALPILAHIFTQVPIQGAIGGVEQASKNLARGDDVTEGVLAAGAQNAALTFGLMGAHAGIGAVAGKLKARGEAADAAARTDELAKLRSEPAQPGMEAQPDLPMVKPAEGGSTWDPGDLQPAHTYDQQQEMNVDQPAKDYTKQADLGLKPPVDVADEQGEMSLQPGERAAQQLELNVNPRIPATPDIAGTATSPPEPQGARRAPVTYAKDNAQPTELAPSLTGKDLDIEAALNPRETPLTPEEHQQQGQGEMPLVQQPDLPRTPEQGNLIAPEEQQQTPQQLPLVQRPDMPAPDPQQGNLPMDTQLPLLPDQPEQRAPVPPAGPPAATQAAIDTSKAPKVPWSFNNTLVGKILNPAGVGPLAENMDMLLRKVNGYRRSMSAQFYNELEPSRAVVNGATRAEQIEFQKAADTGDLKGVRPDLKPTVALLAKDAKIIEEDLKKTTWFEQQQFFENYFPHRWKNLEAAQDFTAQWFQNQGSKANLKERTWPTIADGLRAGLELAEADPIKVWSDYHNTMRKVIARAQVIDAMMENGTGRFRDPPVVGEDGHLQPAQDMRGWTPLAGETGPKQVWAPTEVARMYNNWTRTAWPGSQEMQTIGNAFQRISNQMTGLLFGLNAFHGSTMGGETFFNEVGRGAGLMASGVLHAKPADILQGAKTMGASPASPIMRTIQGNRLLKGYLNHDQMRPEDAEIMRMFEEVNAPMGKNPDQSYKYTGGENLYTSWKRGALKGEWNDMIKRILDRDNIGTQGYQATIEAIDGFGRVLKTVASPLFDVLIPRLKTASSYETMNNWLERNRDATPQEKLRMAAHITNSTDNTMGEMNYENLHWNKTLTQLLQSFMAAPTWAIGTIRAFGSGSLNLAKDAYRLARGQPLSIDPKSPNFNANTQYVLGFYIGAPIVNMAYQAFKTGTTPDDPLDLVAPKTGGKLLDGQPERALLPGYEKELLGWYNSPTSEMYNKLSVPVRLLVEALDNKDYAKHVIYDERAGLGTRALQFAKHAAIAAGPISLKNVLQPPVRGSNISTAERIMAIKEASPRQADSARFFAQQKKYQTKDWNAKTKAEQRDINRRTP